VDLFASALRCQVNCHAGLRVDLPFGALRAIMGVGGTTSDPLAGGCAIIGAGVEDFETRAWDKNWDDIYSSKQMCTEVVSFLDTKIFIEGFSFAFRSEVNGHTRLCIRFPLLPFWALFACFTRLAAGVEYLVFFTGNEYWDDINSSKKTCAEVVTSAFLSGEVFIECFSFAFSSEVNGHTRL